jgi:hypothetical protein
VIKEDYENVDLNIENLSKKSNHALENENMNMNSNEIADLIGINNEESKVSIMEKDGKDKTQSQSVKASEVI